MSANNDKSKESKTPVTATATATATLVNSPSSKMAENHNPVAVLSSANVARTLSISDQHATIMLTNQDKNEMALLKLTLVPFHKTDLACLPRISSTTTDAEKEEEKGTDGSKEDTMLINDDEDVKVKKALREQEEREHSDRVLKFLSRFDWRCTSESGAEYSYHEAFPKPPNAKAAVAMNDNQDEIKEPDTKRAKTEEEDDSIITKGSSLFKAELICPASRHQIARAMPSPGMAMVYETPEDYANITKPFIDSIVASGSLSWLQNIVEVKKEKERLLYNGEGWILNIDTKWRTHPDTFTVPRSEWYQHASVVDLYCLGILKGNKVATLRDLTVEYLPVLRDMLKQGPKVIEEVYGVKSDQLRIFVHYQPQFYHFHVHFTRLENDIGCQVERAHLLFDIIQDLEQDPQCFQKRTIAFKLIQDSGLHNLFREAKKDDADMKPVIDDHLKN